MLDYITKILAAPYGNILLLDFIAKILAAPQEISRRWTS